MFVKGTSGNPGGRPRMRLPDGRSLIDIAKEHTVQAVETLVEVMADEEAPQSARVSAANSILERGWGRAPQALELSGPGGLPVQHEDVSNGASAFTSAVAGLVARERARLSDADTQH